MHFLNHPRCLSCIPFFNQRCWLYLFLVGGQFSAVGRSLHINVKHRTDTRRWFLPPDTIALTVCVRSWRAGPIWTLKIPCVLWFIIFQLVYFLKYSDVFWGLIQKAIWWLWIKFYFCMHISQKWDQTSLNLTFYLFSISIWIDALPGFSFTVFHSFMILIVRLSDFVYCYPIDSDLELYVCSLCTCLKVWFGGGWTIVAQSGRTALVSAADANHTDCARVLLLAGANMEITSSRVRICIYACESLYSVYFLSVCLIS